MAEVRFRRARHCGSGLMFASFGRNLSRARFAQLAIEFTWLIVTGGLVLHITERIAPLALWLMPPVILFSLMILLLNGAFGIYRRGEAAPPGSYWVRVLLAPAIALPVAYLIARAFPAGRPFQDNVGLVVVVGIGGLVLIRHALVLPLITAMFPHRVLVLGTGPEARLVEASLAAAYPPGLKLVGFYTLEKVTETAVSADRVIATGPSLLETVRTLGVNEIIVAVRQQRGGVLPLRALLDCRLKGIEITDLARFFERIHGKVPIELLKVSWLIYGNGYRQDWVRSFSKRTFDIVCALLLVVLTLPVMLVAALLVALDSGFPLIYRQERVGLHGRTFTVLKFRSMRQDAEKGGARWATVGDSRVTRVGRMLRKLRIDELPQLFCVLKGDMSFVGPRPERPEFVAMLTEQIQFYAVRHSVKPGLTGWAQVRYSYGATIEQSARKLEYDLYYVKNHTLALDVMILLETVRVVLLGEGAQ
jgi:sugar transferase (PEP-CTERM system associated)